MSGFQRTNVQNGFLKDVGEFFRKRLTPPIFPDTDLEGLFLGMLDKGEIPPEEVVRLLRGADFGIDQLQLKKEQLTQREIEVVRKLLELVAEGEEELQKLREEGIESGKKVRLELRHLGHYWLPFEEESDGTQRFFQFANLLLWLRREPRVVPIDEVGRSLHPDLVKLFLVLFLRHIRDSQLIVTTHLRELLREQELFRRDVVWFTDRREDGSTDLYSAADFPELREYSSLYNYYRAGRLGAVPNFGDLEEVFNG